jgi:DNA-binding LacI/PurR family transcriptional regulator
MKRSCQPYDMKMTVTMQDVAQAADVSITTVSHVINATRPIAPATRARVQKALKELDYYKNSSARLLVRGCSDALGLIISDIDNPFYPQLIKGFERACHAERLELILGMTNYDRRNAEAAVRRMIEDRVRGVAIMSAEFDSKLVDRLLDRKIPVVRLDALELGPNQSAVHIDYSAGVQQAMDHLASLGHKNVAIVHGPKKVLSSRRYSRLLVNAVRGHGMRLLSCIEQANQPAGGIAAMQELIAKRIYPTAIICGKDLIAIGALGEALRLGWRVPGDVSIIGSDDIAFAVYCHPSLSTVHVQKDEVGLCAFRLLQKMFKDQGSHGVAVSIETEFIPRESTGQARPGNSVKEISQAYFGNRRRPGSFHG